MAFTAGQLAALEEAYAQGVLEVKYQDRTVRYESTEALRRRIEEIRAELGLATSGLKLTPVQYNKGIR